MAKSLVPIAPPHKLFDLFLHCPGALAFFIMVSDWLVGDRFAAAEVFHQHPYTAVPVA